jgi:hypothetical protein
VSSGLYGDAFALLLRDFTTIKPGFKAFLSYHIIVVEAIKDIGQQFCKREMKTILAPILFGFCTS